MQNSATLRRLVRALVTITFLTGAASSASAQQTQTGTVTGRVVDAKSGQALSEVGVQIVGTTRGVMTGLDGRFRFTDVPMGTLTLQVRRIGYQPKHITWLYLDAGATIDQPISMDQSAVSLTAVVTSAEAERGSVNAAIDQQRNSTAIVSALGAEQMGKSPDSDAAQALQRVSGITVQDGKYLNVRGLDPRYTTASLNGARLPSPEPERKVVPFDLFPSNLLQMVVTSKTFTPDQPGDFSGGSVDLRTKESPWETQRSYSLSVGTNDAVIGKRVLSAPSAGLEWLGFGGRDRQLPPALANQGRLTGHYTQAQYNQFVSAFRNVWPARDVAGRPSTSMSMSLAGTQPLGVREIGYVGAFTYSYGQEVRANELRAFAIPNGAGGTDPVDVFTGSTGRESAQWGGVLNLS